MKEQNKYLFVGEKRSELAKKLNVYWEDGRLAAKQLFDALKAININIKEISFVNLFEDDGEVNVKKWQGIIVGMGSKVCQHLEKIGVSHIAIIHPAARGKIRKKELYIKHIRERLGESCKL